jgi:hypothetical protein
MNRFSRRWFAAFAAAALGVPALGADEDKWDAKAAKGFERAAYKGKEAWKVTWGGKPGPLADGAFVPLKGVEFGDGTIEVDLARVDGAKGPYLGVGFRGQADGRHELVYFRPGAKPANAVQYGNVGNPAGMPMRLMRTDPKSQATADLPPNDWFHVRLEVRGQAVKVFVGDGKEPVYANELSLQKEQTGIVGLWAWDGYFADFKVTPAAKAGAARVVEPDLATVPAGTGWEVLNCTAEAAGAGGKAGVTLTNKAGAGVAYLADVPFRTGVIEADIQAAGKYVGFAFNGADAKTYETVYFRPGTFATGKEGGIQYAAEPDFPWSKLRNDPETKGVYEKAVTGIKPGEWFRARVVVTADRVEAFVNDDPAPRLSVGRLAPAKPGKVGLWVGNTSPGTFANLRVTPGGS